MLKISCLKTHEMVNFNKTFNMELIADEAWTHFLAFIEWVNDIGSPPAACPILLFLSNLTLVLFVSFIVPL